MVGCARQPEDRPRGDEQAIPPPNAASVPLPAAVSPFPAALAGVLVFQSDREGRSKIYTIDLSKGAVQRLTEGPDWHDEHPRWSPDGRRIAFASSRHGSFDIFMMNADGTGIERLTDHPAVEHDPTWAPDGRSIVFSGERDGRGELYRVWVDSRQVDRITQGFNRAIMPAVSPDGRSAAYAGQTIRYFQIHVAGLDGSGGNAQLTDGEPACRPAWSPDGQRIVYVLGENPSRLGIVAVGTREARTFFQHAKLWLYYPAFSPDARHIAFSVSPEHHKGEDWDLAVVSSNSPDTTFQRLTAGPGNDRLPHWKPGS